MVYSALNTLLYAAQRLSGLFSLLLLEARHHNFLQASEGRSGSGTQSWNCIYKDHQLWFELLLVTQIATK